MLFFFLIVRKEKHQVGVPVLEKINQPMTAKNLVEKSFVFESRLSKDRFLIPKTLPIYEINTTPLSLEESRVIAKNLGFLEEPTKLADVNMGVVYYWFGDKGLRIIPSLRVIDYGNSAPSGDKTTPFQDDEKLKTIAQSFISDKSLLELSSINFIEIRFLKEIVDELVITTKDAANLADVIFSEKIGGYPVVNNIGQGSTISVKITRNQEIYSVYFDKFSAKSTKPEYPLKNFEELESSLNKAKILSLNEGNIEVDLLSSKDIKMVLFEKVSLAYLQEYSPAQILLQPIFVLGAVAELTDGRNVSARLYLPAISEQYLKAQ